MCNVSKCAGFPGNVQISSSAHTYFLPFILVLFAKQKSAVNFYLNCYKCLAKKIPQPQTKQTGEPAQHSVCV